MHALFFEVRPRPGHLDHYFEHVDRLRPVLARHTGLMFLERYASLSAPDVLLSHQLWDSEDAIVAWRADAEHRRSQGAGRKVHFADYRIRVGARVLHWQSGVGDISVDHHTVPETAHVVAFYGTTPISAQGFESFESVNRKGHFVSLATVMEPAAVAETVQAHVQTPGVEQAAAYGIRRDYGQFDRAQAPR